MSSTDRIRRENIPMLAEEHWQALWVSCFLSRNISALKNAYVEVCLFGWTSFYVNVSVQNVWPGVSINVCPFVRAKDFRMLFAVRLVK